MLGWIFFCFSATGYYRDKSAPHGRENTMYSCRLGGQGHAVAVMAATKQ